MYKCIVNTFSRVWIDLVRLPILLVVNSLCRCRGRKKSAAIAIKSEPHDFISAAGRLLLLIIGKFHVFTETSWIVEHETSIVEHLFQPRGNFRENFNKKSDTVVFTGHSCSRVWMDRVRLPILLVVS